MTPHEPQDADNLQRIAELSTMLRDMARRLSNWRRSSHRTFDRLMMYWLHAAHDAAEARAERDRLRDEVAACHEFQNGVGAILGMEHDWDAASRRSLLDAMDSLLAEHHRLQSHVDAVLALGPIDRRLMCADDPETDWWIHGWEDCLTSVHVKLKGNGRAGEGSGA